MRTSSLLAALAATLATAPLLRPADAAGGPQHHFAVATDNLASSRAALDALKHGGSAADAAIAAAAMLGVTQPSACGVGGGGFALVWDAAQKRAFAIDFRESAPAAYDPAKFRADDRGSKIGVPGEVAGLAELHRRWGKRSFADDFAPAVAAAEGGFTVTHHLAEVLKYRAERVKATPGYAALFAPHGALVGENETVKNAPLGRTLRRIGAEGPKALYEGPIAAELVKVAREAGSSMTEQDLTSYRAVEREPLRRAWEGYDVATMPLPSAGGVMLLEVLGLYSKAELKQMGAYTANYQHMLAEAMRGAIADRFRAMGDPAFVPDRTAELLAPAELRARRARISYDRTHAPARFDFPEQGTTHLVVADDAGNVVTLTTTINSPFAGVLLAPESGILLNDELADFTPPELARKFGFANGVGPNAPRPGARPISSMTPTIVVKDGEPVLATGGSGGMRIANNVTQAILYRLVFDESAERAVSAPRFFTPPTGPVISYGPGQAPAYPVLLDLAERGEQIEKSPWDLTGVQMITVEHSAGGGRRYGAGADPRKGGVAIVE